MPEIHNLIARDLVSRLMAEGGTWDRYTSLYNNTIAPYNLMAVSAALDAVDALSETRSEERSMISPDYARNFICDFILGKKQKHTQLTLFDDDDY